MSLNRLKVLLLGTLTTEHYCVPGRTWKPLQTFYSSVSPEWEMKLSPHVSANSPDNSLKIEWMLVKSAQGSVTGLKMHLVHEI